MGVTAVRYATGRAAVVEPARGGDDHAGDHLGLRRPVWRDLLWVAVRLPMMMLPALLLIGVRYGGPHWWV